MAIPERLRKRIEEQKKDWIVINAAVKLTEENKQLQSRLKKAEDLLVKCKQGYINLVELSLLPSLGYDYSATAMGEEIEAFLRKGGE